MPSFSAMFTLSTTAFQSSARRLRPAMMRGANSWESPGTPQMNSWRGSPTSVSSSTGSCAHDLGAVDSRRVVGDLLQTADVEWPIEHHQHVEAQSFQQHIDRSVG